ncbi:MAG: hypothetical protein ACXW03_01625 [Methylobacter sp.]
MTTEVIIKKPQYHLDVKVKIKNPKTGEIVREEVISENTPKSFYIFDTQSLEIEEIEK